jgi:2-haloalkanoic acid dehalogenase type II
MTYPDKLRCIAFDCFGTVFDVSEVPALELVAYVEHVHDPIFSPYKFSAAWYDIKAKSDSAEGIKLLQEQGYKCVTLSNGSVDLIRKCSKRDGINWDHIIDLVSHRVYKPNVNAYRTIEVDLGYAPYETLMVTANPTFGDVEGAKAVGMPSQIIRQQNTPSSIVDLAWELMGRK